MALACGVRMRLTASLNWISRSAGTFSGSVPIERANRFRSALRWSIATAAMIPRASATASKRLRLPAEMYLLIFLFLGKNPHNSTAFNRWQCKLHAISFLHSLHNLHFTQERKVGQRIFSRSGDADANS